jgi:hypothetical protein
VRLALEIIGCNEGLEAFLLSRLGSPAVSPRRSILLSSEFSQKICSGIIFFLGQSKRDWMNPDSGSISIFVPGEALQMTLFFEGNSEERCSGIIFSPGPKQMT